MVLQSLSSPRHYHLAVITFITPLPLTREAQMRAIIASLILFIASYATHSHAVSKSTINTATKEIRVVVETFRTSIIEKDKAKFLTLFYDDKTPWVGVYESGTIKRMREGSGEAVKASRILASNHKQFIEAITKSQAKLEEKFWNINIITDGSIGSVVFDYNFQSNKVIANWGKEAWQLVNTDDGWKINSVIYTITTKAPLAKKTVHVAATRLTDYAGVYEVSKESKLVIIVEDGKLVASLSGQPKVIYFAESNTRFFDKVWGSTVDFIRDEKGVVMYALFSEAGVVTKAMKRQ